MSISPFFSESDKGGRFRIAGFPKKRIFQGRPTVAQWYRGRHAADGVFGLMLRNQNPYILLRSTLVDTTKEIALSRFVQFLSQEEVTN